MKVKELLGTNSRLGEVLKRYQPVLLVILAGLLLLFLPLGSEKPAAGSTKSPVRAEAFDLAEMEKKLSAALSEIAGAGEVTVVLSIKTGTQQVLAETSEYAETEKGLEEKTEPVVLSRGSGTQETVALQEIYPQFQGALVICDGGNDPQVRLKLTEATGAITGLGASKISICSRGK